MTAFLDLNTRLGEEFDRVRTVGTESGLHALFIDEREVAGLLDALRADVGGRLDLDRLDALRRLVVLDPFDEAVLLACVAPEICPEYERIYGFLQDDISRKRPTVGLLLRLFGTYGGSAARARDRFHAGAPLALAGLVTLSDVDSPLATRVARADERVVRYLLGSDLVDDRLDPFVRHEAAPRPRAVAHSVLRLVADTVAGGSARRGTPRVPEARQATVHRRHLDHGDLSSHTQVKQAHRGRDRLPGHPWRHPARRCRGRLARDRGLGEVAPHLPHREFPQINGGCSSRAISHLTDTVDRGRQLGGCGMENAGS